MPAILFDVTRIGDLSRAGSVDWAVSGLNAGDYAAGQARSGTVSWVANDSTAKTITINTKGNTAAEADRDCIITLSNPVNATMGAASARTTIIDDDAVVPVNKYDQNLAFGGTMLGTWMSGGQVGNRQVAKSRGPLQLVFALESLYPIYAICTENRYDKFPLGSTAGGYSDRTVIAGNDSAGGSDGNYHYPKSNSETNKASVRQMPSGGDIRWRAAKIASAANADTLVLGTYASQTTKRIPKCARGEGWQLDYEEAGGSGVPDNGGNNTFVMYPTIYFRDPNDVTKLAPIDPVAMGWKLGDLICFEIDSTADDQFPGTATNPWPSFSKSVAPDEQNPDRWAGVSRWSSLNQSVNAFSGAGNLSISWPIGANNAIYFNKVRQRKYQPGLLIGHLRPDGTKLIKGNAYLGYTGQWTDTVLTTVGNAARMVFYIPNGWTGRKIIAADCSIWRNGSNTGGSYSLSVRKAGNSPGGQADDGTVVGGGTVTRTGASAPAGGDSDYHRRVDLATPIVVTAGEVYYVELACAVASSSGATLRMQEMLNYTGRQLTGLVKADHEDHRNIGQVRSGTGNWGVTTNFGSIGYTTLPMSLFFGATL